MPSFGAAFAAKGGDGVKDWFSWNGKRCTDFGIHVTELPVITIPQERVTFTNVPGRSGSLTTVEGEEVYEDLVLPVTCIVPDLSRLDEISAWLKGSGKVEFANRPGGYYEARIINQIPFEKILRGNPHREFVVNFRCKPLWHQAEVANITITRSTTVITNPGTVASEPVITVYGSGDSTLMLGTTIVQLTGVSGSITIDTALMECYKGTTSCNKQMSGNFPVLRSGANAISWTGAVDKVVIEPRWRFL